MEVTKYTGEVKRVEWKFNEFELERILIEEVRKCRAGPVKHGTYTLEIEHGLLDSDGGVERDTFTIVWEKTTMELGVRG